MKPMHPIGSGLAPTAQSCEVADVELRVLYEISGVLGQALDLDDTLSAILRILSETLAMERATVTLRGDAGPAEVEERLFIRASHGLTPEEVKRGVYRVDEGVTGRIFRTKKPYVVPDVSKEPLFLDKTRSRRFKKETIAFIGVPIMLSGVPIGVLNVDRLFRDEISFEEDVRFLTIVAAFIAQFVSLNRRVKAREAELRRENVSLKARLSETSRRNYIVGKSAPMERVRRLIEKVAPTRATVLLLGESGVGKTLTARIIHELSERAKFPFVKINCAAFPETLLESELFGHERGTFTGASESRPGRFEEADKGTVFLDEIGELSPNIQVKLLRFLQEREFERLGSTKTRKVDVRIIAATNKNLEIAAMRGEFREDLYYRLNVFPIIAPSLRDRKEDVPALLNHFLDKLSREYGRRLHLTKPALETLLRYDWPGNVREMENLLERLSIMVEGETIDLTDLPLVDFHLGEAAKAQSAAAENASLADTERREVEAALRRHRCNQSKAAKDLGITLRQMGYRVKKFGLDAFIEREKSLVRAQGR